MPQPGWAEEQDGAVLVDEPQRGEVLDELAVHGRLELEVELVEASPVGEAGVAQPGGEAPVAVRGGLLADEPSEELDMRPVLCPGLFSECGEAAGSGVKVEVAEIGLDLLVETGHASSPPTL